MRDYCYDLDDRGVLTLDGAVQDNPWFLDFFFRRLAPNANPEYSDYPFVCRCGDEMNYMRPVDTPIVFTGLDGERLLYGHSLSVHFEPEKVTYNTDGVLYHQAPVGGYGRLVPHVAVEVASRIEAWGPFYAYRRSDNTTLVPILSIDQLYDLQALRPKPENACIACGGANPFSFRLSFVRSRSTGIVRSWIRPDMRMQGSLDITHGGFVSLLLDEVMGKCISAKGIRAPTAQLNVSFRKPMRINVQYELRAWIESQQGRKLFVKGEVRQVDDSSALIAEAHALFLEIEQPFTTG